MQRILVVRLSSIGDIVHALPAVAALGQSLPEAEISWAIESRYAELLQGNPFVSRVFPLDTLGWRRRWKSPGVWPELARSARQLRSSKPGIALDFQGLVKSAVVARLSGSSKRIGFGGPWLREPLAGLLYTERVHARGGQHVVEENFALVELLGVPPAPRKCWQFPMPHSPAAEDRVSERLAALELGDFIVINPGGGWTSKRWAPERFAEFIRGFAATEHCAVLVTGSPAEEPMIGSILKQAPPGRSYYFPSNLMEFVALVRRARLFLGGDTGPLHLAAAVGTPIVAIYGPTSPARNGPFAARDITIWNEDLAGKSPAKTRHAHWGGGRANGQTYLEGVAVEAVLAAVQRRLASANGA